MLVLDGNSAVIAENRHVAWDLLGLKMLIFYVLCAKCSAQHQVQTE